MKTTLIACLGLLSAITASLAEEVVKYPKEKPVFSVTLPDGWAATFEDDVLYASPEDDDTVVLELSPLTSTKKEGAKAIKEMKDSAEETFKNVKYDEMQEGGAEGLGLYLFNAKGEDEEGKANLNLIMVTNGDDDRLFMLFVASPVDVDEEIGKEIGALLASLKKL